MMGRDTERSLTGQGERMRRSAAIGIKKPRDDGQMRGVGGLGVRELAIDDRGIPCQYLCLHWRLNGDYGRIKLLWANYQSETLGT